MSGWTWAARHGQPAPSGSASHPTRICERKARPSSLPSTRSTSRRPASSTPAPARCCAPATSSSAFLGAGPAEVHRHPAAVPHHRPERSAAGHRHHRDRARRNACPAGPLRSCPTSARSTPLPGRCFPSYALRRGAKALGALAQFEFFLVAAALAEGWAVSVPDHEGTDGHVGRPVRTRLPRPRRRARRAALRTSRPVARCPGRACGATPAVGWPRHGPPR